MVSNKKQSNSSVIERLKGNAIVNNGVIRDGNCIMDSLEDDLFVVDRNYRIIAANAAATKNYGGPGQQVVGRHCYECTHNRAARCSVLFHKCPVQLVWETGKPAKTTHIHTLTSNGHKHKAYVNIVASPIKDESNNMVAVIEVLRDITRDKEQERKIADAHKHIKILNTIATIANKSLDLNVIMSETLEKILKIMKANSGGILLLDERTQKLKYIAHHGLPPEYVNGTFSRSGKYTASLVARTHKSIIVSHSSNAAHVRYDALMVKTGMSALVSVPIRTRNKIVGVVEVAWQNQNIVSEKDRALLESIAKQISIAIENAKLLLEVQKNDENRRELLQEILSIQEEERKRISRELHDEISQTLLSLAASIETTKNKLDGSINETRTSLDKARNMAIDSLDYINKLSYELRPTSLDDLGLVMAIQWLVDNKLTSATVTVDYNVVGQQRRLPPNVETTIFRVVQEAFSNIARHAHAKHVQITLQFKKKSVLITIKDDGSGFDIAEAMSGDSRPRGLGLLGMKERVELVRGVLNINTHPGKGTVINLNIPCE